ncbi:MAG: GGDEF domain-containing protein, partial [Wenzhouxiangellaceae bacterium]
NGSGEALVRNRVIKREALLSTSPVGRALKTGKPAFANHCRRDALLSANGGSESALGYKSAAAVPLLQAGRVVGAFAVYAIDACAFDRDEARLLIELGASLNIAIANLGGDNARGSGAEQDAVTGLPNRGAFERQISWALERTHRRAEHVALIVLDVDGFRSINDTLGREAGDRVLKTVATLLRASIRPGDLVGRLGSDEFGVLLTGLAGNDEIGAAVDHVVKGFPQRLSVDDQEVQVSVSMGVGVFPADAQDADELFACAELALHNAPSDTRGQIAYYEPELNEQARRQRGLELALQGALPEKDFRLAWQPIIDVRSGDLFGAEALLRWRHPILGEVPPDVFIPLAELSGQIISIGRWVLEESIRQGQIWADCGMPLDIHVNVSLLQLQHPGFVDELAGQMKTYKTSQEWKLVIEMTESQFMADSEATASSCRRIKALGCNIDLDDFGTGYSALGYLTRLPLDALKLDRSFVVQVEHDPNMLAVVEAVVGLARRLGLAVVAEGVETRSHLELLKRLECNYAQGYLFGRPDTAEKLVERWHSAPASAGQSVR